MGLNSSDDLYRVEPYGPLAKRYQSIELTCMVSLCIASNYTWCGCRLLVYYITVLLSFTEFSSQSAIVQAFVLLILI